jgi:two-component system sensor histidine kinase KdpD
MDAIEHDFRSPLTSIKVSVSGMLTDLNFDKPERKELLSIIDEECDRINRLVDEASELARLESGEVTLDLDYHPVGALINAALADSKTVLGSRPVELNLSHEGHLIQVDLFWATKVLVHLIANASLYSSLGRPITISTHQKEGFIWLSVTDQGQGIDETELVRIFEKFYRGKDQRSRSQGTGMGLPIAKAIVEAHGGTISAVSAVGVGSNFTFSLPIGNNLD